MPKGKKIDVPFHEAVETVLKEMEGAMDRESAARRLKTDAKEALRAKEKELGDKVHKLSATYGRSFESKPNEFDWQQIVQTGRSLGKTSYAITFDDDSFLSSHPEDFHFSSGSLHITENPTKKVTLKVERAFPLLNTMSVGEFNKIKDGDHIMVRARNMLEDYTEIECVYRECLFQGVNTFIIEVFYENMPAIFSLRDGFSKPDTDILMYYLNPNEPPSPNPTVNFSRIPRSKKKFINEVIRRKHYDFYAEGVEPAKQSTLDKRQHYGMISFNIDT